MKDKISKFFYNFFNYFFGFEIGRKFNQEYYEKQEKLKKGYKQ